MGAGGSEERAALVALLWARPHGMRWADVAAEIRGAASALDEAAISHHAGFIWSVAQLLRRGCKQSEYGKGTVPFTVLHQLDCVVEPTETTALEWAEQFRQALLDLSSGGAYCKASGPQ